VVLVVSGCDATGLSSGELDFTRFLGFARPKKVRFCASLSDTAPIESGADIRDVAPFVERRKGPGEKSTTHVLWPFWSSSRSGNQRSFALRPIVASDSRPGYKRVSVLWPLATYTRRGDNKTLKVFPLFMYKRRVRSSGPEQEVDTDWWLFPVLFGGHDTKEGGYFAVFPLGGTLKGQLGKKQISFVLWPLWMKTRDKHYDAANVMWPFMSYWKGKDQSGRRLWPFFGANRRENRFDRRFYVWPFVSRWKAGLDTKRPGDALFVFPFYGHTRNYYKHDSGERELYLKKTTVLFPLFHHVWRKRVGKDKRRNLEEVQAPWPFLGYERGDGLIVRKLWPIWGERKTNDLRHRFFMWPLYRRSMQHFEEEERRWLNLGLLFSTRVDRWVEVDGRRYPPPWPEGFKEIPDPRIPLGIHKPWVTRTGEIRSRRWVQLWPLFHYRRTENNEKQFQLLSLLPKRAQGRAETLWRPFYTLYRYERDKTGQKRESFLFGLIRHTRRPYGLAEPGMRYVNIAGIVSYNRRARTSKKWSLLGGLIGYERVGTGKDARRAYRFLWAPFGRIPRELRERYDEAYRTGAPDGG
jgi:hypothetical protein